MSARRPPIDVTSDARADLREISLHSLRNWGPEQRTIYRAALRQAMDTLRRHPEIGLPRDELRPGYRSFHVRHHVII
jgi:toxin ParE1/3/4